MMRVTCAAILLLGLTQTVWGDDRKATLSLSYVKKQNDGAGTVGPFLDAAVSFSENTTSGGGVVAVKDATVTSVNTVASGSSGKLEMCVYTYGGFSSSRVLGDRVACSGNVGTFADSTIFDATLSSSSLENATTTSLIGRAGVLEKRTVMLKDMTASGAQLTVGLFSADSPGTPIDSQTFNTNETEYFQFDFQGGVNAPALNSATYLEVTANGGNETYVFAEYTRDDDYFFKTLMITNYDRNQPDGTFNAYTVLGEDLSTYINDGWSFQRKAQASTTPTSDSMDDAFEIVALGTIGISADNSEITTGGADASGTERVMCAFNNFWGNRTISGSALLSKNGTSVSFQASVTGLQCAPGVSSCENSFHFHDYGDLRGENGAEEQQPSDFGDKFDEIELGPLTLAGQISAEYSETIASDHFQDVVGMTLTVHDGPSTDNATIAWGVCGVADPSSCLLYGCAGAEYEIDNDDGAASSTKSPGVLLLLALSLLPIVRVM